jgi:hypothetical protein
MFQRVPLLDASLYAEVTEAAKSRAILPNG